MYIADDPTLALITRFVGETENLDLSDAEFLLQQIAAIERYVASFPDEERQERALEWITTHARHYRQQWQKQAAVGVLAEARCPDCPLAGDHRATPCAIHGRWLELLRCYAANKISSRKYVEDSLKLLSRYKDRLKVGRPRQRRTAPVLDSD
ncbi:MAG: hypothetical protein P9E67_07985 [Candidatus Competibacter sp.]|nr:hypothetical protein [Candidatus Competibacter sp.]